MEDRRKGRKEGEESLGFDLSAKLYGAQPGMSSRRQGRTGEGMPSYWEEYQS